MSDQRPNYLQVIGQVLIIVAIGVVAIIFLDKTTNIFNTNNNTNGSNTNVVAPNINIPININTSTEPEPSSFQISGAYSITSNPYDNYDANAFRVALNGKFKELTLVVKGKITDNKQKFVSINFGLQSGVLNAVRLNDKQLDYEKTIAQGGVFDNSINFSVDLFAPTVLATSREEFLNTRQASKTVTFWDSISATPNVFTMLVAAFNADGSYTGTSIEEITLKYRCEGSDNSCGITKCQNGQLFTSCLTDSFGRQAARAWCDRTKSPGCESL